MATRVSQQGPALCEVAASWIDLLKDTLSEATLCALLAALDSVLHSSLHMAAPASLVQTELLEARQWYVTTPEAHTLCDQLPLPKAPSLNPSMIRRVLPAASYAHSEPLIASAPASQSKGKNYGHSSSSSSKNKQRDPSPPQVTRGEFSRTLISLPSGSKTTPTPPPPPPVKSASEKRPAAAPLKQNRVPEKRQRVSDDRPSTHVLASAGMVPVASAVKKTEPKPENPSVPLPSPTFASPGGIVVKSHSRGAPTGGR